MEDLSGASVEVILFPSANERYGDLVRPDSVLLFKGRVDQDARDDSTKFIAMEVLEPKLDDRPLVIGVDATSCTRGLVSELREVLGNHPGSTQVLLRLEGGAGPTMLRLGSEFSVDTGNGLHAELKAHLGTRVTIA